MALSKGQRASAQEAGQIAFGRMQAEVGIETPAEAAETEKGISGEPTTYEQPAAPTTREKALTHETLLRERGFIHRANELTTERQSIDINTEKLKNDQQILRTKSMRMGIQLSQAGDIKGGIAEMNTNLPEGQRILSIQPNKDGKTARIISEDQPDGFQVNVNDMITAFTSAETQFKERNANLRARQRQLTDQLKPRVPTPPTNTAIKRGAGIIDAGHFNDIIEGASTLSDGGKMKLSEDIKTRAAALQEEARLRKQVLGADAAEEAAAREIAATGDVAKSDKWHKGWGPAADYIYKPYEATEKKDEKDEVTKAMEKKKKEVAGAWSSSHMSIFNVARKNPNNKKYSDEQLHAGIKVK